MGTQNANSLRKLKDLGGFLPRFFARTMTLSIRDFRFFYNSEKLNSFCGKSFIYDFGK